VGGGMMLHSLRPLLFSCLLLGVVGAALAADKPAVLKAPAVETLFAAAPAFKGALGEQTIQASLRQKADMREGLEGEYFVFGNAHKILLAGEFDADGTIVLEESDDGRRVSGEWEGKLDGDVFSGTWSSFDGAVSKPFSLKIIPRAVRPVLTGVVRN
jgi:hypothetical protein